MRVFIAIWAADPKRFGSFNSLSIHSSLTPNNGKLPQPKSNNLSRKTELVAYRAVEQPPVTL